MRYTQVIGIDEAGRGALAGPVAVGAVLVPTGFDWEQIPGVVDSKKLSPKRREAIFEVAKKLEKKGILKYAVALIPHTVIDRKGITHAVSKGIEKTLSILEPNPKTTHIKLDGLLSAPKKYLLQRTIVKGDVTEKEISLASIMAKVTRDRYMVRVAKRLPVYSFEIHKGYGTKIHQTALKKNGISVIHRTTFTHLRK